MKDQTTKTLFVKPAPGRRVRAQDGWRPLREDGETVALSTYYRRRLAAGDLIAAPEPRDAGGDAPRLEDALAALEPGNPDHWTEAGKPDLNHLSDTLNRRVTRKEVDAALRALKERKET